MLTLLTLFMLLGCHSAEIMLDETEMSMELPCQGDIEHDVVYVTVPNDIEASDIVDIDCNICRWVENDDSWLVNPELVEDTWKEHRILVDVGVKDAEDEQICSVTIFYVAIPDLE